MRKKNPTRNPCPSRLVQTEVKCLALSYKTAYLSGMSRIIRSDYRGVTKCIAKVVSFNFTIEPKFSRQKIAFITEEIA